MKGLLVFAAAALTFSSCTHHYTSQVTSSNAPLEKNITQLARVRSTATATYVFGIGGNNRIGLTEDARESLLKKYPLQPGETLANITVDHNKQFRLFSTVRTTQFAADIITSNTSGIAARKKEIQEAKFTDYPPEYVPLLDVPGKRAVRIGNNLQEITITKLRKDDLSFEYEDKNGNKVVGIEDYDNLYIIVSEKEQLDNYGFTVGDSVIYTYSAPDKENVKVIAIVKGFHRKKICIESKNNKLRFVKPSALSLKK